MSKWNGDKNVKEITRIVSIFCRVVEQNQWLWLRCCSQDVAKRMFFYSCIFLQSMLPCSSLSFTFYMNASVNLNRQHIEITRCFSLVFSFSQRNYSKRTVFSKVAPFLSYKTVRSFFSDDFIWANVCACGTNQRFPFYRPCI